jgi:TolB-like protein/Tfp pilus assembly protein PilF
MSEEWTPDLHDNERVETVRRSLHDILVSDAFKGGKRAQDFLTLIVDHALAGRLDNLRERMIGAEMFGRPISYDTANDAVVRVKASEVRKKLLQYYQSVIIPPVVRIDLPAGSYVPQFYFDTPISVSLGPSTSLDSDLEEAVTPNLPVVSSEAPTSRSSFSGWLWLLLAAIFVVVASTVFLFLHRQGAVAANGQIRSIAILPLLNYSRDPKQEYFADGMTEELTTELGQVTSLRVISRTSTMSYKGTTKTLPEIAKELHVDGIVEGSIEREANQVRITVQLIDSKTDQHIWAHSYDRDMTSVLELQSDVARAIADQIQIELTPQQQARLNRTQHVNPEAVELYLQGIQRLDTATPKDAIGYFQQAIEKDPSYAAAHATLANTYGWMGEAGWMPYSEAFSKQRAEALRAIELDDSRPEGHLELGMVAMNQDWDWATQKRELERALALDPSSTKVHWAYANYLDRVGRPDEAITEAKVALQLDPISSGSYMSLAWVYYFGHKYAQALEAMQRAAALHANATESLFPLGDIYVEKGRYDEGIEEFKKLGDMPHALGHMGNAYARAGKTAEARATLPKVMQHIEKNGIGRYEIALVYAGLGENDNAFAWLEKAFQSRDKGVTYLKMDPCLETLHSDSRFKDLVKRVGLPQ